MKYIIFGTGRFYQNRKEMIRIYDEEGMTENDNTMKEENEDED